MYQAFVFINEEICSPALAHDKEKKKPSLWENRAKTSNIFNFKNTNLLKA